MKPFQWITIFGAAVAAFIPAAASMAGNLEGDYVEARTASVFAGPCHYSGEYLNDGREAVVAWHVVRGASGGVSLAGLSAVAVVRSDSNLGEADARKSSMLYVDSAATPAQRDAFARVLEARCGKSLGVVKSVESATVKFSRGEEIVVGAPGVASLDIAPMPNHECCKQPSLVWYKPIAPVDGRMVGYTKLASCTDKTGGDSWSRSDENSAFYGTFRY